MLGIPVVCNSSRGKLNMVAMRNGAREALYKILKQVENEA